LKIAARIASLPLMIWATSLSACTSEETVPNEVQREAAERQALIDSMKDHPALQDNRAAAQATGKPIDVPATVPPKPADSGEHDHHDEPRQPDRN
jgi:hypothetical protein